MLFHLSFFVLAPVYLLQGKYVRRVTPKLAEPEGARKGSVCVAADQAQRPLKVLITGDSAAAGVGVSEQTQALSGRLAAALGDSHALEWTLLAQTGDTSADLVARLEQTEAFEIDIALISIGVNDVTALKSINTWQANLARISELLRDKFKAQRVYFSAIPPMHHFPALPQPLRWWLGTRARQLDAAMQNFISEQVGCTFVDTPFEFDLDYIAADGFHPGAQAYGVWAEHVASLIRTEPQSLWR